jgi:hypothetical protein
MPSLRAASNLLCLCVPKVPLIQKSHLPQWVNVTFFVVALFFCFNISWSKDDWKDLTDPYDYLRQSKISLPDKEFYFPHVTANFAPRPFTVPLFYKLCRSNTDTIVLMQRFMLLLGAFFMVVAFMLFMEKDSSKYLIMAGVYLMVLWWNVMGWANLVLSEALSTALLFCWLASFLFLHKKNTWPRWLLHAAIAVLFAFTRDSWPYMLVSFYAGVCILWFLFKLPGRGKYVGLLLLSVAVFLTAQAGAKVGLRYKLPVINSIVVRVLPRSEYTQWFVNAGMPCAEKLKQNFAGLDVVPVAGQHKLWSLYTDTAYQPFLNWVVEIGHLHTPAFY